MSNLRARLRQKVVAWAKRTRTSWCMTTMKAIICLVDMQQTASNSRFGFYFLRDCLPSTCQNAVCESISQIDCGYLAQVLPQPPVGHYISPRTACAPASAAAAAGSGGRRSRDSSRFKLGTPPPDGATAVVALLDVCRFADNQLLLTRIRPPSYTTGSQQQQLANAADRTKWRCYNVIQRK